MWLLTFYDSSTLLDNYCTALESRFSSFCLLRVLPTLSSTLPLSLSHAQFLLHLLISLYHFRMGGRLLALNHFSFGGISHIARRHVKMSIPTRHVKMGTPMVLSVSPNFPNCMHFVVTWNYPCLKYLKFILLL